MRRSGADCGHDRGKVTDAHVKSAFLCLASCSFSAPVYLGADPDLNTDCLFFYSSMCPFSIPNLQCTFRGLYCLSNEPDNVFAKKLRFSSCSRRPRVPTDIPTSSGTSTVGKKTRRSISKPSCVSLGTLLISSGNTAGRLSNWTKRAYGRSLLSSVRGCGSCMMRVLFIWT